MRTYQRVNASNGFDAVGNMLVVGTAFIWVPVVAVWIGWMMFSQWAQIGDYSPKKVAAQEAKEVARKQAEWKETIRVDRDKDGKITWVNPNGINADASSVLPISDPYAPTHSWIVKAGSYTYLLWGNRQNNNSYYCGNQYIVEIHEQSGKKVGTGCYTIVNNVIVTKIGERTIYFDKGDAVEGKVAPPKQTVTANNSRVVVTTRAAGNSPEQIQAAIKRAKQIADQYQHVQPKTTACDNAVCAKQEYDAAGKRFIESGGNNDLYIKMVDAKSKYDRLKTTN